MRKAFSALLLLLILFYGASLLSRTEVLFSPDDQPTKKLLAMIDSAKKRVYAAVYMLTDKTIAEALIAAKKYRRVDVQIVTDKISVDSPFGKGKMLQASGITVFVYSPPSKRTLSNSRFDMTPIMHHKFALFDDITWTGSFNWTVKANRSNQENVLITDDKETLTRFASCFDRLKTLSRPLEKAEPQRHAYHYSIPLPFAAILKELFRPPKAA